MSRRPPKSKRTNTPFPYRTLFRLRDALGPEQGFCRGHFPLAGLQLRVARVRAPLLADLVQALGVDAQREQLVAVGAQARRQAVVLEVFLGQRIVRSEEHTSELQSLMRLSYAVFCLKKTKHTADNR